MIFLHKTNLLDVSVISITCQIMLKCVKTHESRLDKYTGFAGRGGSGGYKQ